MKLDPTELAAQLFAAARDLSVTVTAESDWKPIEESLESHRKKALCMYFTQDMNLWTTILGEGFFSLTVDGKEKVLKKVNSFIEKELCGAVVLTLDGGGKLLPSAPVVEKSDKKKSK